MEIVLITAKQLIVMMSFMAIGYLFKKKGLFTDDASSTLSKLVVNVFLPAMVFSTFAKDFRIDVLEEKMKLLIVAVIVITVTGIAAVFLAKTFSKNKDTRAVYIYSFTIPNLSYMGYPLVKAIFGDAALLDTMVFSIPYNIYAYTIGMYLLTPIEKINLKFFLNPAIIATVAGMAVGLTGVSLPQTATSILDMASSCMAPCAMLLTGIVFARIDIWKMFGDWRAYAASAIRLLIIPITMLLFMRAAGLPGGWILAGTAILAMPLGLNTVVFPEAFNGDSKTGARMCFVSGLLGLITIPLVFGLL